ncbi:hypothetical protein EVAR_7938_1 [Eumeta japonica]|uniref:Uncharacterized protein n=1 Tax=Eumeta variegata TaxID=151549 RepID=A0A4C1TGR8_EUMVA|nr:hypothetical protein EVAR_7938_1 [Eumeta japonica]
MRVCFDHTAHSTDVFVVYSIGQEIITKFVNEIDTTALEFCKSVVSSRLAWCFIAKSSFEAERVSIELSNYTRLTARRDVTPPSALSRRGTGIRSPVVQSTYLSGDEKKVFGAYSAVGSEQISVSVDKGVPSERADNSRKENGTSYRAVRAFYTPSNTPLAILSSQVIGCSLVYKVPYEINNFDNGESSQKREAFGRLSFPSSFPALLVAHCRARMSSVSVANKIAAAKQNNLYIRIALTLCTVAVV